MSVSKLSINTVFQNEKTIMSDCFFTSPCKVAKPFYRDDGYTEIMVMCASPGILAGDKYDIHFNMADNTKTVISEQSYRKLYNTGDSASEQNTRIQLGENAALHYVPYPVIPFKGSRFHSRTNIELRPSSKIIYGDIVTCGRHGMGEQFAFTEFSSRTTVTIDGKLAFLDNNLLFGKDADYAADFSGLGFFEGHSCQGFFFLYGFGDKVDKVPADISGEEIQWAISKSETGHTMRMLGNSANSLYHFAKKLFSLLF